MGVDMGIAFLLLAVGTTGVSQAFYSMQDDLKHFFSVSQPALPKFR
jgi:hypothetical protein